LIMPPPMLIGLIPKSVCLITPAVV
jgi:hypothetical protein